VSRGGRRCPKAVHRKAIVTIDPRPRNTSRQACRGRKSNSGVTQRPEKRTTLDGLLALLGPRQTEAAPPTATTSTSPYRKDTLVTAPEYQRALPLTPVSNATDSNIDVVDRGFLTIEQCNVLLEKFRDAKTPQFPFVVISPNTDAATLRRRSPFIFLAIITASLDLRLDNPPLSYSRRMGYDVDKNQISVVGLPDENKHGRTAAELRAFLGCYYLCLG
jgi:hypothetical protein